MKLIVVVVRNSAVSIVPTIFRRAFKLKKKRRQKMKISMKEITAKLLENILFQEKNIQMKLI